MKLESLALVVTSVVLLFFLQLLTALAGVGVGLFGAALVGVTAGLLGPRIKLGPALAGPLLVAAASAVAISLVFFSNGSMVLWLSPAIAFLANGTFVLKKRRPAQQCTICRRNIQDVAFTCPRCEQPVCDNNECWRYDLCRCRRCEENNVPLLTGTWWRSEFGDPILEGKCFLCGTTSKDRNLLGCRRCGKTQCASCWDNANGQCAGCGWLMRNLPHKLRIYMQNKP